MDGWEIYKFLFLNIQRIFTITALVTLSSLFYSAAGEKDIRINSSYSNQGAGISFTGFVLIFISLLVEVYHHLKKEKNSSDIEIFDDRVETIMSFAGLVVSGFLFLTIGILFIINNDKSFSREYSIPLSYITLVVTLYILIVMIYTTYRTNLRTKISHETLSYNLIKELRKTQS